MDFEIKLMDEFESIIKSEFNGSAENVTVKMFTIFGDENQCSPDDLNLEFDHGITICAPEKIGVQFSACLPDKYGFTFPSSYLSKNSDPWINNEESCMGRFNNGTIEYTIGEDHACGTEVTNNGTHIILENSVHFSQGQRKDL